MMATGRTSNEPGSDSVLMLRNWLLEKAPVRGGQSRDVVIYNKTERALASYLTGEAIAILYAASTELFPLPKEKPTKKAPRHQQKIVARIEDRKITGVR
jgi:hypothetical protein